MLALLAVVIVVSALAMAGSGGPATDSATRQGRSLAPAHPARTATPSSGELDVGALMAVAGLGLAIAVPVVYRARIAGWVTIRRFQTQLRSDNAVDRCRPAAVDDAAGPGHAPSLPE